MAVKRLIFMRYLQRLHAQRYASSDYVNRVRLLEYWNQSDNSLESEFPHSKAVLMVDKEPLVAINDGKLELVKFETGDLRSKLNLYGLEIGLLNSCLLDVVPPCEKFKDYRPLFGSSIRTQNPPAESKIDTKELKKEFGLSLGGRFQSLRMAMLNLHSETDQSTLSRFQAVTRWSVIMKRCPTCASTLRLKLSKWAAKCIRCQRDYYPTNSPVSICLIHDKANKQVLLVKHLGSLPTIYTLVAGFAMPGESIQECVRREIAEEIGIECTDIKPLNYSQSWPMPQNSLMLAFTAIANPKDELSVSPGELDAASWFSRNEVQEALDRTNSDPLLKGAFKLSQDTNVVNQIDQNKFGYIPPRGAVAYKIIEGWLQSKF